VHKHQVVDPFDELARDLEAGLQRLLFRRFDADVRIECKIGQHQCLDVRRPRTRLRDTPRTAPRKG